jgi:hypothetical protein
MRHILSLVSFIDCGICYNLNINSREPNAMEQNIQRHPPIEKSVALIYITDPNFLERSKSHLLVGDYSKDGYQVFKTPVVFVNSAFKFKFSFEILHRVRVNSVPSSSCEATMLRDENGQVFDIKLADDASVIEGMTEQETEKFIKDHIKLMDKDHYKALQTALNLHFASRCR